MTPDSVASDLVTAACADDGALLHAALACLLSLSVVASALANLRKLLPGWFLAILDAFALNFVSSEKKGPS